MAKIKMVLSHFHFHPKGKKASPFFPGTQKHETHYSSEADAEGGLSEAGGYLGVGYGGEKVSDSLVLTSRLTL